MAPRSSRPGRPRAGASASPPRRTGSWRRHLTIAQEIPIALERRLWNRRAGTWDEEGSRGLAAVIAAVTEACEPSAGLVAVDLGCGSGQVTIPLAARCERVLGVDVSPLLLERLHAKSDSAGVTNIETLAMPIEALELEPASVDLVVSNYALHHLRDSEKAVLLCRATEWLRPGGRLVVGDMMFGRGAAAEDRRIVAGKLNSLVRRGPGGWWRIVKNLWRFGLRLREKPLSPARWEALARAAGFTEVRTVPVRAEASLLLATQAPAAPAGARAHAGAGRTT